MLVSLALSAIGLSPDIHARGARGADRRAAVQAQHRDAAAAFKPRCGGPTEGQPSWLQATDLYSGFFTIDEADNTYFMFSTALGAHGRPVVLWLNGGPGASSLLGTTMSSASLASTRAWTLFFATWRGAARYLLALDNPLGVGYSNTDLERMATNQTTVGADLYEALRQFFELFPELRANPFYATGESYAESTCRRRRTRSIRRTWRRRRRAHQPSGLAIGDGAFDPPTQFTGFGELLFNIGLADTRAKAVYEEYDRNFTARLAAGDPRGAFRSFDGYSTAITTGRAARFTRTRAGWTRTTSTSPRPARPRSPSAPSPVARHAGSRVGAAAGLKWRRPSLTTAPCEPPRLLWRLRAGLNSPKPRPSSSDAKEAVEGDGERALKRSSRNFQPTGAARGRRAYSVFNQTVEDRLLDDWVVGVVPWLETLLEHYNVLIYSGQYDVILGPPGAAGARPAAVERRRGVRGGADRQFYSDSVPTDLADYSRLVHTAATNTTLPTSCAAAVTWCPLISPGVPTR